MTNNMDNNTSTDQKTPVDDDDGIGYTYPGPHIPMIGRESLGIGDLDLFFSQVYKYFLRKGFWCMCLQRLLKLFSVLFMIVFSTFLFVFVDWRAIWSCKNQECAHVRIVRPDVFTRFNLFHKIAITFESAILCYWLFLCSKYLYELVSMWEIKHFYNVHLNITERDIQTLEWDEIVNKIIELQQQIRICLMKDLDAFDIMNRIMRRENFLIAFINREVLNLRVPLHYVIPGWKNKHGILTESLMWNLKYIINFMFDSDFKVKEEIINNPDRLRRRFIWLGILNMIASPFIFFFVLVYTFFKYSIELRQSPLTLIDRRWTLLARWKFREFNELPHIFERRIKKSYKPAKKYTEQFPVHMLSIAGKSIMFITSALAATIIVVSSFKNPLLLYFNFLNQNLFWWLTILLLIWAYAKSMVIDEHKVFEPKEKLEEVCAIIHYYPDHWKEKGHHLEIRDEFMELFQYSLIQLIQELLSILVTPLILCFSLPKSSEAIVKFMNDITLDLDGVGHVCGFATFNFNKFGSSVSGEKVAKNILEKSMQDKMAVSYLNFKAHYPSWQPPRAYGSSFFEQSLVQSMDQTSKIDSNIVPNSQVHEPTTFIVSQNLATPQTQQKEEQQTSQQDIRDKNQELSENPSPLTPSEPMHESKYYFHLLHSFHKTR